MCGPHRDVSTTGMAIVLMMQSAGSHPGGAGSRDRVAPEADGDNAVLASQQIATNWLP